MFTTQDFKTYRSDFGFNNQGSMKSFLSAKDIVPSVNYAYVDDLNIRLVEIMRKISKMSNFYTPQQLTDFLENNLRDLYT